jgi:hypothetical protein
MTSWSMLLKKKDYLCIIEYNYKVDYHNFHLKYILRKEIKFDLTTFFFNNSIDFKKEKKNPITAKVV